MYFLTRSGMGRLLDDADDVVVAARLGDGDGGDCSCFLVCTASRTSAKIELNFLIGLSIGLADSLSDFSFSFSFARPMSSFFSGVVSFALLLVAAISSFGFVTTAYLGGTGLTVRSELASRSRRISVLVFAAFGGISLALPDDGGLGDEFDELD